MPGGMIAIFVVVGIAMIFGVILASQAAKKRRMALRTWALERGWHFTPDEVSSLEKRFPLFKVFQQGDNRYGYNVMRGEHADCDLWAFDYHYQTYSTDSKGNRQTHHHHFSALIIDSGLLLSPLSIRAEGVFDKLKGAFGFDDIDFESAEFSRKFWVTAPNKRWAYDVIHQGTMEFLLGSPRFTLEMQGPHFLVHRGRTFKPQDFAMALHVGFGVLDRIPKDIRKRLQI